MLGWGKDRVRRAIARGRLTYTTDPLILGMARVAADGRGRPPKILVSLDSLQRVASEQEVRPPATPRPDETIAKRLAALESELAALRAVVESAVSNRESTSGREPDVTAENARLRAEVAKAREVARLAVVRGRLLAQADEIGQDQVMQFLGQDFVND